MKVNSSWVISANRKCLSGVLAKQRCLNRSSGIDGVPSSIANGSGLERSQPMRGDNVSSVTGVIAKISLFVSSRLFTSVLGVSGVKLGPGSFVVCINGNLTSFRRLSTQLGSEMSGALL